MTDEFAALARPPLGVRLRTGLSHGPNWIQLMRFAAVGATGYAVNLGVFAAAVGAVHYATAAVIAFLAAVTNNFLWNRHWTFRVRHGRRGHQALRFLAVSLVAFGVSLLVLALLVERAGVAEVPAQAVAVVAGLPVNFLGQKLWTFAT